MPEMGAPSAGSVATAGTAALSFCCPLNVVGVSIVIERGCQHFDSTGMS